jgi:hypothetical protein
VSGEAWEAPTPELRELVREVLRDVLPGLAAQNGHNGQAAAPPARNSVITEGSGQLAHKSLRDHGQPAPGSAGSPHAALRPVRLATDAELHEFVLHILALADNPKRRRDLLAGRLRFTLAPGTPAAAPADHRVEKGAVTERAVQAAAAAGARLVLGPRAVLTPLARDRARTLGVPIEKER